MKIRAVTTFFDPALAASPAPEQLAACSQEITTRLQSERWQVQSQRVATGPFASWLREYPRDEWPQRIHALAQESTRLGWQYLSIGPAQANALADFELLPSLLAHDDNLFAAGIISAGTHLYPAAAKAAARVIAANAHQTADGFTNLRFAALANVGPGAPFLPAAYAQPQHPPAVALAIECADEAVQAFSQASNLEGAGQRLLSTLENNAQSIQEICRPICAKYQCTFNGFDFSPAPYPAEWCSLGKAMELLGVTALGMGGSLAAAAWLANLLDQGAWQRVGFNGLMLPVLEDSTLAQRAASGVLTLKDLLLYSAVCGTGLDTIPLAGDTSSDALTAVLLDLGALAIRLNKPLTARLMPIPGKQVGDLTEFEFEFFANSRVMAATGEKVGAPLLDAPVIEIIPRKHRE